MDCVQILLNTFFAFLSAIAGVLIGNWWTGKQLSKLRLIETEQLCSQLIQAFRFNIIRLNQMSGQLTSNPPIVPDYRLDTEGVSHILFHGRDLFVNQDWFTRFNWQRYQLVHINAKVDFLNDVLNVNPTGGNVGHTVGLATVANQRFSSLAARLPTLVSDIEKLIAEYEAAKIQ